MDARGLLELRRYTEVVAACQGAEGAEDLVLLGRALAALGRWRQSADVLRQALIRDRSSAEAWLAPIPIK